jgi:5-methyltetrahydrofolate--homocysteine methyltransferase
MGTQLIERGLKLGESCALWNIERPREVQAIHRAYREAGCDLITTNTFGGNRLTLSTHGLADHARDINSKGAANAREAAGEDGWVLGDVGPFGGFLAPAGDMTADALMEVFTAQLQGLKEGGVDGIMIETMVDPAEVAVAVQAARQMGDWPVIATYAFSRRDGAFRTLMGTTAERAMQAAIDSGADVVGANCGTALSPDDYAALAEELLTTAGDVPVIVQPNAGAPRMTGQGVTYPASPAEMAKLAAVLCGAGVKVIGGCCGTTPAHLRAMASAVRAG